MIWLLIFFGFIVPSQVTDMDDFGSVKATEPIKVGAIGTLDATDSIIYSAPYTGTTWSMVCMYQRDCSPKCKKYCELFVAWSEACKSEIPITYKECMDNLPKQIGDIDCWRAGLFIKKKNGKFICKELPEILFPSANK